MSGGDGGRGEERERASAKSGQSVSRRHDERQNGNASFLFSQLVADYFLQDQFRSNYLRNFLVYCFAQFQQLSLFSNQ